MSPKIATARPTKTDNPERKLRKRALTGDMLQTVVRTKKSAIS